MLFGWKWRRTSVFEKKKTLNDSEMCVSEARTRQRYQHDGISQLFLPRRAFLSPLESMANRAIFAAALPLFDIAIGLLELDFQHFYFSQIFLFCFALHTCARHGNESEHFYFSLIEAGAFGFLKAESGSMHMWYQSDMDFWLSFSNAECERFAEIKSSRTLYQPFECLCFRAVIEIAQY